MLRLIARRSLTRGVPLPGRRALGQGEPIDQYWRAAFDAETIVVITEAFETACHDCAHRSQDPITEVLALKIIEAAQTGERDPNAIRQQAMDSLAAKHSLQE